MFICSCSVMLCMDYFPCGKQRAYCSSRACDGVCVCTRLQQKCLREVHQCVVNICLMLGVASLTFSPSAGVCLACLCATVSLSLCVCVRLLLNLPHRLQMENDLRQRERQQEKEREREREAGLEREREREEERGRERERELDRQKERQRERQQQMVRAAESHYLAELQARMAPPEDRVRPGERLTPNRLGRHTNTRSLTQYSLSLQGKEHGQ